MKAGYQGPLERLDACHWRIPKSAFPGMRVDGIIYADDTLAKQIRTDNAPIQVANVAHLPGIVRASLAMPDIHWGYGFPIGGVAAVDLEEGAVSPGGVGYDINCGVRVVATRLEATELRPHVHAVTAQLYRDIPTGVGSSHAIPKLTEAEMDAVLSKGARWAAGRGYVAGADDLEHCEEGGRLAGADPSFVS